MSNCLVYIHEFSCVSALGMTQETEQHLFSPDRLPRRTCSFCPSLPPNFASPTPEQLPDTQTLRLRLPNLPARKLQRTEYLLACTLSELSDSVDTLKKRYGAHRIGVILGTSTAGMFETETYFAQGQTDADYSDLQLEVFGPARLCAQTFGLTGPTYAISTACTSSAKALAEAARLIQAGIIDAAITGGVDGASRFTVAGFNALGAMTSDLNQPFAEHRPGLNLGEGGAIFILSKETSTLQLAGWGESCDAHHITAPDPSAEQVKFAIRTALQMGNIDSVDYVNLHGTGTEQNDKMEALAVYETLGSHVACSSTKSLTGHTLGGAGALEAAFCCLALLNNRIPKHFVDTPLDPTLAPILLNNSTQIHCLNSALSHSFAFGGNNAVLLIRKVN